MSRDTKVLDRLFEQYKVPMGVDDGDYRDDYEWVYYVNDDYSITLDAYFNDNEPNEYEARVYLNDDDSIEKTFKEGEETELIKFITTDKLILAQDREFERINKDFK